MILNKRNLAGTKKVCKYLDMENEQHMVLDTLMLIAFFSLFSDNTKRWDFFPPLMSIWAEAGCDVDGDISFTSVAECKHRGTSITTLLFHPVFVIQSHLPLPVR